MLAVDLSVDWGGRPLSELERLVDKRIRQLNESTENALFATAAHVIRSLKPLVKVVKLGKAQRDFTCEDTGLVLGKYQGKPCPHTRYQGDYRPSIRPILLYGGGIPKKVVHIYKITPKFGDRMTWKQNAHQGCWYVAALTETVAKNAGMRLMRRAVDKYKGLARTAVGAMAIAAKRATGGKFAVDQDLRDDYQRYPINRGMGVADATYWMAKASYTKTQNTATLKITNNLAYAAKAFTRSDAVDYAMAKAANSIAGMLRKRAGDILDPSLETPFPEIAQHRRGA